MDGQCYDDIQNFYFVLEIHFLKVKLASGTPKDRIGFKYWSVADFTSTGKP